MSFLLDTMVVSESIKTTPHPEVTKAVLGLHFEQTFISVLTVGELWGGIMRLPQSRRRDQLVHWFDELVLDFTGRILPVTADVACKWGDMATSASRKGVTLAAIDGLIGATAACNDLVVMTRNVKHFYGVEIINPWPISN